MVLFQRRGAFLTHAGTVARRHPDGVPARATGRPATSVKLQERTLCAMLVVTSKRHRAQGALLQKSGGVSGVR